MGKKRRSSQYKDSSKVIDMDEARRERLEKRRAEKEREELKRKAAEAGKSGEKMAFRQQRKRRRLITIALIIGVVAVMCLSVGNVLKLKQEQHRVLKQQQELQAEKKALEKELKDIGKAESIEEEARDQLKLIKKGEKLYMFPEEITNSTKNEEDGQKE